MGFLIITVALALTFSVTEAGPGPVNQRNLRGFFETEKLDLELAGGRDDEEIAAPSAARRQLQRRKNPSAAVKRCYEDNDCENKPKGKEKRQCWRRCNRS